MESVFLFNVLNLYVVSTRLYTDFIIFFVQDILICVTVVNLIFVLD